MRRILWITFAVAALAMGATATATAASSPPWAKAPETINLCFSVFQTDPGQWGQPQASELFALGYWQPYAVKANIGVTVIGDYHFICNLPAGYAVTTPALWVDEGGLVVDATKAGVGLANGGYARIAASA